MNERMIAYLEIQTKIGRLMGAYEAVVIMNTHYKTPEREKLDKILNDTKESLKKLDELFINDGRK